MKRTKLSNEEEIKKLKEDFNFFRKEFSDLDEKLKIVIERSIRTEERHYALKENLLEFKDETANHFKELKDYMEKFNNKLDELSKTTWAQKGKLFVLFGGIQVALGFLLKELF